MTIEKTSIIIDCDPGTDDAIALLLAAFHPALNLLGVTVTHGNRILEMTLENALRVIEFSGKDIPVYKGCSQPMVSYLDPHRKIGFPRVNCQDSHGDYLPLPDSTIKVADQHGVNFLIDSFSKPNDITLVTIGPLTNVAIALRMAPEIAENINRMVIMGGTLMAGSKTTSAETNMYIDSEAAKIVMQADIEKIILPLDATWRASLVNRLQCEEMLDEHNIYLDFISKLISHRIDTMQVAKEMTKNNWHLQAQKGTVAHNLLYTYPKNSAPVHDALAVAYVINPAIITELIEAHVDIDIGKGLSDGRLVVDYHNSAEHSGQVQSRVAVNGDSQAFYQVLMEAFGG